MNGSDAYRSVVRLRDKAFSLLLARSFASFGRGSVIQTPARLGGTETITIGNGVFVGAGSWLQTMAVDDHVPRISIGDGCSLQGNCTLSAVRSIALGEKVLFARGVYVSDHSHAFEDLSVPVIDQGVASVAPVVIEDGAWIGQNVVIGPGVRIGRGAVIGANAVVRDDIPAHSVAVGAPARVVRTFDDGPGPDLPRPITDLRATSAQR